MTKIIIENSRATGIADIDAHQAKTITARREVIVSAGPLNSPKLLMLSGVGPADELREHHIRVIAGVAGVGRNLENHPGVDVQWSADHED